MSDTESAAGIEALTGTFVGLTVLSVGLRFGARKRTKVPLLADDWLMLGAVVSFLLAAACVFYLVSIKSLGYSTFKLPPEEMPAIYHKAGKPAFIIDIATIFCLACTKASALFFYRRIFGDRRLGRQIYTHILTISIVIVAAWWVTFEVLTCLQCSKIPWALIIFGLCVSDVILDVWVLLLPIPRIIRLQTTVAKRISIIAVFMLACVGLGASLARLVVFVQLQILNLEAYITGDSEHFATRFRFFYMLECGCSIVAINLPSLWPTYIRMSMEGFRRLAQSVTSLISQGKSSLTGSRGAESQQIPEQTPSADQLPLRDIKDPGSREAGGHLANATPIPTLAILRSDSVQVSSKAKTSEDDVSWQGGWRA